MREAYRRDGFVNVALASPAETVLAAREAQGPPQPVMHQYNTASKRLFESWKYSQAVRDIAWDPAVVAAVKDIYGYEPRPFQTISFTRGSLQPMHTDGIHFQTVPAGRLVGAWVALEDVDEDNGPVEFVAGSHRLGDQDWHSLGMKTCEVGGQEAEYRRYEKTMTDFAHQSGSIGKWLVPQGTAVVMSTALLHAGGAIRDPERTRHALVVHYFVPPVDALVAPMFGPPGKPLVKRGRWFDREGKVHDFTEA